MTKILIVDDSAFSRNLIKKIVESGGHEVIGSAANGTEALELFNRLDPDLIALDYLLPDINGDAVLERILQQDAGARVIIISGSGGHTIGERALKLGAKAFVEKIHLQRDLLMTIDQVMEA